MKVTFDCAQAQPWDGGQILTVPPTLSLERLLSHFRSLPGITRKTAG